MFLPRNASRARLREAENARKNRQEILTALSHREISRRDLVKWGLVAAGGLLVPIQGLSPFARSAYAASIPTELPPSPTFGAAPFTQPMPRFDVLPRHPEPGYLNPAPTKEANTTLKPVDPYLGGGYGPIEGRPPGPVWAHQHFEDFPPKVAVEVTQEGAKVNTVYNPGVPSSLNSGIDPTAPFAPRFHPNMPVQGPLAVWTFNGTLPPKLVMGRYGEPILFRHHNRLPAHPKKNGGFGKHTISTHEHNGHHGAENDGFTGAFFFPGQFYDYHWPICHAGYYSVNPDATDPRCAGPGDDGYTYKCPGDWHETMSTHWFHDHMFSFTQQNVYKGNAAMFNIYSALDRGAEDIADGINLRLPSGRASVTGKSWGNLDYDVNLMLADKAWDGNGQLAFDIFDTDGFLGDMMTVNLVYKPYFEVERRKYRFRILNAGVGRYFKVAMCDAAGKAVPMTQIGNDGNLLPSPVTLNQLDQQGIAERYDVVVDFSKYKVGDKLWMVNLAAHATAAEGANGRKVLKELTIAGALSGNSPDPCVGKFMEFRIVRDPAYPDVSQVPSTLCPNPDYAAIPVSNRRTFEFGRDAEQTTFDPITSFFGPWGIRNGDGAMLAADYGRVSAAPKLGTREIWTLKNGGGGWDHPVHIHFEEGHILARDGSAANVPKWERGRKDVYRLRPGGEVRITIQFRDFKGMFMQHCHNTTHEDNAMLMRWEIDDKGGAVLEPLPTPIPTPQGVRFQAPGEVLPDA